MSLWVVWVVLLDSAALTHASAATCGSGDSAGLPHTSQSHRFGMASAGTPGVTQLGSMSSLQQPSPEMLLQDGRGAREGSETGKWFYKGFWGSHLLTFHQQN